VSHVTAGALTYLFSSQAYASDRSDWSVFGPSCRRSMPPRPVFDPDAVSRQLRARLNEWRGLLRANVGSGRRVLGKLLKGCLTFTRRVEGRREFCEFSGEETIRPILERIVGDFTCYELASLMTASWNRITDWLRQIDAVREAA
jgi:hypothetical protein